MRPLDLAKEAARGEAAFATITNMPARKRNALKRHILANTTQANRDLYARFYGGGNEDGHAWRLLVEMA